MKIELQENKTVKIVLTYDDMCDYDITYEEMDYQNPQTKHVLLSLIGKIKAELSIDFKLTRLLVEAFPYIDGGCILYISSVDSQKANKLTSINSLNSLNQLNTPIIYKLEDINVLSSAVKQLYLRYNHIITKSELFLYEEKYLLMLYTYFKMDNEILALLNEYGSLYGRGTITTAIVKEHAREIISDNAIEKLCQYT